MKKFFLLSFIVTLLFLMAGTVKAADTLIFDSTNNYLGACQLTNKAEWESKEDLTVTKFQIWYYWDQGETSVPVTVLRNGEKFAEFDVTRSQCDPYQHQWCNGDYVINKSFLKGTYFVEIPKSKMCLKPGATGTVRLYGNDSTAKKEELSPTPTLTPKLEKAEVQPTLIPAQPAVCSCSQTIILVTAAATSLVTSLIVSLILRR